MRQEVNEQVDVLASFTKEKTKVLALRWGNTKYIISKLNMVFEANKGREKVRYFSVSDNTNNFTLAFNPNTLVWTLKEVYFN